MIDVMIVDDSATVRAVISAILSSDDEINISGVAHNPVIAWRKMESDWPDVVVSDIEMPEMDGISFLKKIMKERPTPVIICSAYVESGANSAIEALSLGAVEIITKPNVGLKDFLSENASSFVQSVKAAAKANPKVINRSVKSTQSIVNDSKSKPAAINKHKTHIDKPKRPVKKSVDRTVESTSVVPKHTADVIIPRPHARSKGLSGGKPIIAIGSSTGGTSAVESILVGLSKNTPGVVITQHMPEKFTGAFAKRLNGLCEINVKEAETGDVVVPGTAFVAPGHAHLLVNLQNGHYVVEIKDGELVSRHRPSVDVLFRSVAISAGRNAVGVILTGMGSDGAEGMYEMYESGAKNIAENEESCVVFGMPNEAIKRGGVHRILALDDIRDELKKLRA